MKRDRLFRGAVYAGAIVFLVYFWVALIRLLVAIL